MQRENDDWVINTIMLEGYDVPLKYKRRKVYKSLKGARVNLIFYPETESIASIVFEVMNVVRIRRSYYVSEGTRVKTRVKTPIKTTNIKH